MRVETMPGGQVPPSPSQTDRPPRMLARILAVVSLVFAVATLALLGSDLARSLDDWPYAPLIRVGDDLKAVIGTQARVTASDTFMIGLAARTASPESGPATLVVPTNLDDLHEPWLSSRGDPYPWVNLELLDDLLTSDIVSDDYDSAVSTATADALVASGELQVFSEAVLAPPLDAVPSDGTLALYSVGHGRRFVLMRPELAARLKDGSDAR